jgi:hypothetical protein
MKTERYFHAEARVAVANGLKFVAINNIPLEKNRRSSFNVLSKRPEQQPHLDAEFSFNIVAGSGCGKTTTAHQFVFANATPERPALHFTILGASPRYQPDGISGAQLPAPFGAPSAYHRSQVAPARGNLSERVGPLRRCGPRYSARSTVEATRKAERGIKHG